MPLSLKQLQTLVNDARRSPLARSVPDPYVEPTLVLVLQEHLAQHCDLQLRELPPGVAQSYRAHATNYCNSLNTRNSISTIDSHDSVFSRPISTADSLASALTAFSEQSADVSTPQEACKDLHRDLHLNPAFKSEHSNTGPQSRLQPSQLQKWRRGRKEVKQQANPQKEKKQFWCPCCQAGFSRSNGLIEHMITVCRDFWICLACGHQEHAQPEMLKHTQAQSECRTLGFIKRGMPPKEYLGCPYCLDGGLFEAQKHIDDTHRHDDLVRRYVAHLVSDIKNGKANSLSQSRRLKALMQQPLILQAIQRLYAESWFNLSWDEATARSLADRLEYGYRDPNVDEFAYLGWTDADSMAIEILRNTLAGPSNQFHALDEAGNDTTRQNKGPSAPGNFEQFYRDPPGTSFNPQWAELMSPLTAASPLDCPSASYSGASSAANLPYGLPQADYYRYSGHPQDVRDATRQALDNFDTVNLNMGQMDFELPVPPSRGRLPADSHGVDGFNSMLYQGEE